MNGGSARRRIRVPTSFVVVRRLCTFYTMFLMFLMGVRVPHPPSIPHGWFGLNGPLRQYFSLYRAVSQREGERGKNG